MSAENPLRREALLLSEAHLLLTRQESLRVRAAFQAIVAITIEQNQALAQGAPESQYLGNQGGIYDGLGAVADLPTGFDQRDTRLDSVFCLLDLTPKEAKDVIPHPRAFKR